jgi:hypothetical protein
MTYNLSTRTLVSTFAALAMAAALPQASFAMGASDAELWTVNVAKSKFSTGTSTLIVERAGLRDANATVSGGAFLVISDDKVYLAMPAAAYDANKDIKTVAYTDWKGMKLVQIGDQAHARVYCGFRCQSGLLENHMTVTFKSADTGGPQINNLLAANKH